MGHDYGLSTTTMSNDRFGASWTFKRFQSPSSAVGFQDEIFLFRQAVALTKNFPKIALLELDYRDGDLWLSYPGKVDLRITPDDLEPTPQRSITMRMYDVNVNVMHLGGGKFDRFVNEAVGEEDTDNETCRKKVLHKSWTGRWDVSSSFPRRWLIG